MSKCTDPINIANNEVLDIDKGHEWVVVEWVYSYCTNSASSYNGTMGPGTVITNTPYPYGKKASKIMCIYCKKVEDLYI